MAWFLTVKMLLTKLKPVKYAKDYNSEDNKKENDVQGSRKDNGSNQLE